MGSLMKKLVKSSHRFHGVLPSSGGNLGLVGRPSDSGKNLWKVMHQAEAGTAATPLLWEVVAGSLPSLAICCHLQLCWPWKVAGIPLFPFQSFADLGRAAWEVQPNQIMQVRSFHSDGFPIL